MVKRIVRYIFKSAQAVDIVNMPWEQGIKKFLHGSLSSYSGSRQERPWFYELHLGQTLGRAAWQVLKACKGKILLYEEVYQFAVEEWASWLDETLHNKAICIAVEEVYQQNSKVQEKIFTSLKKTYPGAVDMVLEDRRPLSDLEKMQAFLKHGLGTLCPGLGMPCKILSAFYLRSGPSNCSRS